MNFADSVADGFPEGAVMRSAARLGLAISLCLSLAAVARAESDADAQPPARGVAVCGTSTIMFWTHLKKDMAPLPVFRVGVGGARMDHCTSLARKFVLSKRPRIVALYAGDNDLAVNLPGWHRTPEEVLASFEGFTAQVHAEVPDAWVFFISIKPSPRRWDRWEEFKRANALVQEYADRDPRVFYVDVTAGMLDAEGQVRPDLFRIDGLHLNRAGYALWTETLKPELEQAYAEHVRRYP